MSCFLFQGLSESELEQAVAQYGEVKTFKKGGDLYRLGFVGILKYGSATVLRSGDTGQTVTVRTIGSGECFGAASVFGEWREGKSLITAKAECEVVYFSEAGLRAVFEKHPSVAVNYISFLSDRIRFLNRRIDAFSAGSAVQKLYEYLVSQAEDGKVSLDCGLAELARRLKMGRSSLYRSLQNLENSGLLERNKNTFTLK